MLISKFKNDLLPDLLKNSEVDREYNIDWSSLKSNYYSDISGEMFLQGKAVGGKKSVRIASVKGTEKSERPVAVFFKQKKDNIRIEEAYYLTDEEVLRFESMTASNH